MSHEPLIKLTDTEIVINFTEVPTMHGTENFLDGLRKQGDLETCIKELQVVLYDLYNRAVLK